MVTVLVPLPARDFDPTEVAVPWQVLRGRGHEVVFATPDGQVPAADELMLTGRGLDPWGWLPGTEQLRLVGRVLSADRAARAAYGAMSTSSSTYRRPGRWDEIDLDSVDALLLPGGHRARGMRPYLESELLQTLVVEAFARRFPVAAICHGVLLAARSIDPATGRSVLHGRRTTSLTWSLERRAWAVARWSRFWDPSYYRTYTEGPQDPPGYMSVQAEVTRALARPEDFLDVAGSDPDARFKRSGRHRDTLLDERPAFVVRDGTYLSARWPGDAHTFAKRFADLLETTQPAPPAARRA